jgi:ubiquitin-activating enzyme E1
MSAFFGGIVAQEIVKFTGKYTPLKQWLHFDIYETLPREENIDRKISGNRLDD